MIWHHLVDTPATKRFVQAFSAKYNRPPENQAWGDYVAMKIVAQAMNETKSIDAGKLVEHLEKGAKFDVLKKREGYFRDWDHQLINEMYPVTAKPAEQMKDQWDIMIVSPPVPGPDEPLEAIAPTKEENACNMA